MGGTSFAAPVEVVVEVRLNQQDKGQFFVKRGEDGTFFMKPDDLRSLGLVAPLSPVLLDGEPYQPLAVLAGVRCAFDEMTLSLEITADPRLLPRESIDFSPQQPQKVYYPTDTSVYFNYGADCLAGNGLSSPNFSLTNELGARVGDLLFLNDALYSRNENQERLVRLQTSLTLDDRKELVRFVAGDLFATSGELGSTLNLGGVSLSKVYAIDPYFISYPTINVAGQAAVPSEARIYLNGVLLRTERLAPGQFQIANLVPFGAAGALEVVLKDQFGKEQRLSFPFYYAGSSLLRRGLHEYSYNAGLLRRDFGTRSFDYASPAFSGFHRYGASDSLTIGLRAEGTGGKVYFGPQASVLLGKAGLLHLSVAGSSGGGDGALGGAGLVSYLYQGVHLGINLSWSGFSRNYTVIAAAPPTVQVSSTYATGVSYTDRTLGTLSLIDTRTRTYQGQSSEITTAGYTRNLTSRTSLTFSYTKLRQQGYDNRFFLLLNYTPKQDLYVSTSYQAENGSSTLTATVQKNPPVGEGFGYRVNVQAAHVAGHDTAAANPSLQYNGRHGIYLAEYNRDVSAGALIESYHFSSSGALVYLGGRFAATRPVTDSFGLVKVGDLPGVQVLVNSQPIGRTDGAGEIFVPTLGSFYNNELSLNPSEIPMDYYLSEVKKVVSPPLHSGTCTPFVVKKMQPISGTLEIVADGNRSPVEFQEFTLDLQGQEYVIPTGKGGAFDIDLGQSPEFTAPGKQEAIGCQALVHAPTSAIVPGTYRGTLLYQGVRRSFMLTIPPPQGPATDLGVILIEANQKGPETVEPPARGR